jgi:hypothetical protein
VPEQQNREWRHKGNARQDEPGTDGCDAAHHPEDDGGQNPRSGEHSFRMFELHDVIVQSAAAWRCSEMNT